MTSSITMNIPELETERLRLRAHRPEDFDAFAAFYGSERAWGMGGPLTRAEAWRMFATEIGHWVIRGYGLWMVEEKASAAPIGVVGFWNPEGWQEVEIGWAMFEGSEGKGYAYEAALTARTYAYETLGWGALTSVIAPGNDRSIALATRLGAHLESDWTSPTGKAAQIYRHPSPEARA